MGILEKQADGPKLEPFRCWRCEQLLVKLAAQAATVEVKCHRCGKLNTLKV